MNKQAIINRMSEKFTSMKQSEEQSNFIIYFFAYTLFLKEYGTQDEIEALHNEIKEAIDYAKSIR